MRKTPAVKQHYPISRSENMRRIRSNNTAPELLVRRLLYSLGYRYRLHRKDLPGKPDIVFVGKRKVIFVHGCFWHAHGCSTGHQPRSNQDYWSPKLARNVERDAHNRARLEALGWKSLIVWECNIRGSQAGVRTELVRFLEDAVST